MVTDSGPVLHVRHAYVRYRENHIEYSALQVVGRGLFLALVLMVVFLYVFTAATSLMAGQNEVIIPTTNVDPAVDLGAIVRGAFTQTSGSVVSIVGVATLLVSSVLTARALRVGTRRALLDVDSASVSWTDPRTLLVAAGISLLVLVTWLLTLATSIRRAAWSTLLGSALSDVVVDIGKVGCIVLQFVIVLAALVTAYWLTMRAKPEWRATGVLAVVAAAVVVLNFFLLYTYVGALLNPRVSAGVVLVFTLLLWANTVVRAYLGGLCWIATNSRGRGGV